MEGTAASYGNGLSYTVYEGREVCIESRRCISSVSNGDPVLLNGDKCQ